MKKIISIALGLSLIACTGNDLLKTNPDLAKKEDKKSKNYLSFNKTVYFGFDQFFLTPRSHTKISRNYEFMKKNKIRSVRIVGHTDRIGTKEYNHNLGLLRAESVRDHLVALGFPKRKIQIISYGETRPAIVGSDEAAFRANRRAEIIIR